MNDSLAKILANSGHCGTMWNESNTLVFKALMDEGTLLKGTMLLFVGQVLLRSRKPVWDEGQDSET